MQVRYKEFLLFFVLRAWSFRLWLLMNHSGITDRKHTRNEIS